MSSFRLHPQAIDRERLLSGVAVAIVHVALGWALLSGLGVSPQRLVAVPLAAFDVTPPEPAPPPPPPARREARAPREEGRAAPPNLTSRATPVAAPTPQVVLPVPPTIVTAPTPAVGDNASSGAADQAGPGTGSGGIGDGTGSGGRGTGPGGGGGGRPAVPRNSSLGTLDCADPESTCSTVEVTMRFTVGADGRVSGCQLLVASRDRQANREACPRAERRLRFRPALDARGKKVATVVTWEHEFVATERTDLPDD